MGNQQLAILVGALLVIQVFTNCIFIANIHGQTAPDVYVGIDISYGSVGEAKALIDQVSSFTNLFVVGTTQVTWYPDRVNEIFQYAYDKGLSIISLPPALPTSSSTSMNKTEWYEYAHNTWGNRVLGFYYLDEPGGRQLDLGQNRLVGNGSFTISSYEDAAYQFTDSVSHYLGSEERSGYSYKAFTSDYALYWFDYKAGYDAIFAELGWNLSRSLNVALCRGAATAYNKEWGAIIAWTYTEPPYIESGSELYKDLVLAYDNGAKYIVVFDGNEGWTHGILEQEHLDALQQFWDYVHANPRKTTPVSDRTAYVLPSGYGFGFRGPQDHIWGIWEADALARNISLSVGSLLRDYGERLDIIYEDSPQSESNYGYKQIFYWGLYSPPPPEISIISPENTTYTVSNVSLTFTINNPVSCMRCSLDGQEQVALTENTTLYNLPEGPHSITVYATDEFESTGTSDTIYFTIDLPEPFPTATLIVATSVAAAAVVAVMGVGLLVYFKRRKH